MSCSLSFFDAFEAAGFSEVDMKTFPVIRVTPHHFSGPEPLSAHVAMIGCSSEAEAIADYNPRPGENVEFAWWAISNIEACIPAY
jgi:hypothetical protein